MRSRLLAFGPGGYPSHAYFAMPFQLCYIVKLHLTLIRFRASGVPIARNPHLTTIMKMRVILIRFFEKHTSCGDQNSLLSDQCANRKRIDANKMEHGQSLTDEFAHHQTIG